MSLDFNDAPLQAGVRPFEPPPQAPSVDEVRASLLGALENVLGYLYPNGFAEPKGRVFYIGDVTGAAGESLRVELTGPRAGLWHDFATADGGDIFSLWRAARGLSSFRETLQDAAEYSGAAANVPRRKPVRKQPKGGDNWGAPVATYRYQDASGNLLAEVDRFEWTDEVGKVSKTFRPWDVATRSYRAPETRPLYNLPNIIRAPEIVLVEGEKAADALISQNIDATTAMGGASAPLEKTDWSALKGRKVVIWPDNDTAGKAYAERLKGHLEAEGALAVSILTVAPSRPEKWDAADAAGEDLGALIRSMRSETSTRSLRQSQFFPASDFANEIVPPRRWHVDQLIPSSQVTMLGGDGGVGKSLLALQLAIATATGGTWIGTQPVRGRTVYISAEDDRDELHRRMDAIAAAQGARMADLGDLIVRSLAGEDALLAVADSRSGTLQTTPLLVELDQTLGDYGASLLVLDTLADLHSGQENDRTVARQFISILRGLALRHDCTILLLAHPSLTGMSSGSGLSGSTGWNNSVRSRLYIERVIEDGFEPDADMRKLSTKKSNYGKTGQEIKLRWSDGAFTLEHQEGGDEAKSSLKARRVFLSLIDLYTREGRRVNAAGGPNYAPAVMASDSRREGVTRTAFIAAMTDLFAAEMLETAPYGPPSRGSRMIVRKA